MTRHIRGIRGRSNRVFPTELQTVARDAVGNDSKIQANHKMIERRQAAPQVTIDALMLAFRTGGLTALDSPNNKGRLATLSAAQQDELRGRIKHGYREMAGPTEADVDTFFDQLRQIVQEKLHRQAGKLLRDLTHEKQRDSKSDWWEAKLINVRDLCDQKFPEIKYVVPGVIPEGVTLLASRPKVGKSWLMLQIGAAVATGVAGLVTSHPPLCGDVLYLALEDNRRRLQRRLTKYFGAQRENWPERLTVVTEWRRLDQGGLEAIRAWCNSVTKPTLILIDTLKRVRPPKRNGSSDYDADYEACQGLQSLAGELGVAIIVAHHDRKMDAENVFDTVSGTLGLTGGVDTIAVIKRRAAGTTLHVEGRDLVENIEKAISFDRETCRWTILGEAAEVQRSEVRAAVLATLVAAPAEGLGVRAIMDEAGIRTRDAADQLLGRMAKAGDIKRPARGKYSLPGTPLSEASEKSETRETIDNTWIKLPSNTSDISD